MITAGQGNHDILPNPQRLTAIDSRCGLEPAVASGHAPMSNGNSTFGALHRSNFACGRAWALRA